MNGTWTTVEIAGKQVDIYDLASGSRPRFGALYLHGIGLETLKDNHHYSSLFDELGIACICPYGQRSWWADRICEEFDSTTTAEHHVIKKVLPCFEQRWGLRARSVAIFGISMGGQGALRMAFKHPKLFPVVAGIASALDHYEIYGQGTTLDDMYNSKEQCRQDGALLHIHPSEQPPHIYFSIDPTDEIWHRGNDRLHEKLSALGVRHTCDLTTQAGGHSWDYFNAMADPTIRFMAEGLQQESFRLL